MSGVRVAGERVGRNSRQFLPVGADPQFAALIEKMQSEYVYADASVAESNCEVK
jgi:hypothetical protein